MAFEQKNQPGINLPVGLAQPVQRALAGAGIESLEQLSKFREDEISHLHGIGPNAMLKLKLALAENGLSLIQPE